MPRDLITNVLFLLSLLVASFSLSSSLFSSPRFTFFTRSKFSKKKRKKKLFASKFSMKLLSSKEGRKNVIKRRRTNVMNELKDESSFTWLCWDFRSRQEQKRWNQAKASQRLENSFLTLESSLKARQVTWLTNEENTLSIVFLSLAPGNLSLTEKQHFVTIFIVSLV